MSSSGRAISEQTDRSTGTVARLRRWVEQLLADHPDPPPMPTERTFYRLVARLSAGRHTFGRILGSRRWLGGVDPRPGRRLAAAGLACG